MKHRIARVKELLKRELTDVLTKDFDFGGALVTVNEVDVTPDFRQAHAYLGIITNDDRRKGEILDKLNQRHGFIQNRIMSRVVLKYTPQFHFKGDDSIERGIRLVNLIDSIAIPTDGTGDADVTPDPESEQGDGPPKDPADGPPKAPADGPPKAPADGPPKNPADGPPKDP